MTSSPPWLPVLRMLTTSTSTFSDVSWSWCRSAFMIDSFGNSTCSKEDDAEDEDDSGDNEGLSKDDDDDDDDAV